MPCSCCNGCGRCVVNGHVNHDYRTRAECERCRVCVEAIETECDGDCPPATAAMPPLVTLGFSSEDCGTGGSGSVVIGCGQILSATVTNGGSGYATETISEPTLTATAPGGTGGVLSISGYTKLVGGYYVPTGITVVNGGGGYADNAQVTLSLGTDDEWAPGSGAPGIKIRTQLDPPADEWTLTPYASTGSGLVVSLTLALVDFGEEGYAPGYGPIYEATAATVMDGGTDYEVGTEIDVQGSATVEGNPTVVVVSSVDGDGAVTGLSVLFGGYHEGTDTGVISSVVITSGRPARKRTVEACEVAVSIVQESPSAGTGATITATVETNSGENFGTVTGLTVTNGGSGYVALCEKKTTVASCDECSPRESPESAICEDNGGCPCGTWVFDSNQEPCACCQWTLSPYFVGFTPSESSSQELNDCICNAFNQAFEDMGAAFAEAGWTVTLGPPPDGQQCGGSITAVCEECERAFPDPISADSGGFSRVPCNPDHWVDMPSFSLGTACGTLAFIGYPSLACVKGGQIVPGEVYGLDRYYADGKFYIPKCGQRITECKCCRRIVQNMGLTLEEFDSACCGDCPQGYGPQWTDQYGNLWPTEWVCASGRCNPLP